MRLRQLFEATQTVGFIFGRFNPPHKGHKAAWEMLSENDHWYVGTNKSTQGPKDPLPYDVKIKAMSAIWPEVADHIIPHQSWLTLAAEIYKKHGEVELKVYTDEAWVLKTLDQYNGVEKTHGYYNFPKITSVATPRLSSATALRKAVADDDRDAFADAAGVPADTPVDGKPFFDLVAEYLNTYKKEDASGEEEDEFHRKLDKLVHKTFGHSSDEKKKKKYDEDLGSLPSPEAIIAIAAAAKMTPMAIKALWKTAKGAYKIKKFADRAGIKLADKVTSEKAPPGREKQVKALKKKFDDPGAPYAIAWAQHNKKKK